MPKGVYDRSPRVNIQKVSEMPERQSANANVEVIRQSSGDPEISTTERLFGSPAEQLEDNTQDPNISQEPLISQPVAQNPEQAEQPRFKESNSPKPEESTPETDDFIDWEKMSGRKIRQKIDGKEVITTVEELKKYSDQDQIKKHLAEQADRVGQERRKLAEERQQWNEQRSRPAPIQQPEQPDTDFGTPQRQPQNDPVFQRIQFLEQQVQQLAQGIQPSIYESNRQRVSNELKAQGFNDFNDYLPKMESIVGGLTDPNLISFYDTKEGSKALYFQLKAQDLQKAPPRQAMTQNVPRGIPENIPATQIDGGAQSSGQHIEPENQSYKAAFRRAVGTDDRDAWNEVLMKKRPDLFRNE